MEELKEREMSETHNHLKTYLQEKMSLSHIYQPAMIKCLLQNSGKSSPEKIAQEISAHDPTQIEYYTDRVNQMVGRVLRKNGVADKAGKSYTLNGFENLSDAEVLELTELCDAALAEYIHNRGTQIFDHRRRGRRPISGSIRYQVLKRAKGRCELCGISAEEKRLDVDHIHPKSLGGKDDLSNYQALCFSCNAAKGNTDDTDFRGLGSMYDHREEQCLFCEIQNSARVVSENALAYLTEDAYPVTEGHALVIPKRHVEDYFGLSQAEINAINQLLTEHKDKLEQDSSVTGFNIGANCGDSAGQTVFHCHMHLIPRRKGDMEDPRGGVRHVIPSKANYKAT